MIGYISGTVVWVEPARVIMNAGGVGYEVVFQNRLTREDQGNELALYICHKISEYGETMYGFLTMEEKLIFETLDDIKGVGSKVVYSIITGAQVKSFSDLQNISLDELVKLNGVGRATAQKFLLGLSNKLKKEIDLEKLTQENGKRQRPLQFAQEIETLVSWGMKRKDLETFVTEHEAEIKGMNSEQFIKHALKHLHIDHV
ncbi:MAG: Holliday junction branch migration protein RuvA [Candidatus Dojkabacteria bacterium]